MDPITIAMLGTSALQGISTLLGGFASAKAAAAQAQQAQINARNAGIASTEIAEQSQFQLRRTLGTISALQTSRGVDNASPTAQAINAQTVAMSDRNEGIARFGDLQQQQSDLTQAAGYRTQADWAIPLSVLGAGAQVAGGVSKAFPNWGVPSGAGSASLGGYNLV